LVIVADIAESHSASIFWVQPSFLPFSYGHFWQIHSPLHAQYHVTTLRPILDKITT
jgi:hypothetical protein